MTLRPLLLLVAVLLAPFEARAQAASAYSPLDLDRCRKQGVEDGAVWTCAGHAGIGVRVAEGDLRMFVSYGAKAKSEPAMEQTLGPFNKLDKTIEWRLLSGKPFATILRWHTQVDDNDRTYRGRVLVVTRLAPGGVCHVAHVDALEVPNANVVARELADGAPGFRCGTDKVVEKFTRGVSLGKTR